MRGRKTLKRISSPNNSFFKYVFVFTAVVMLRGAARGMKKARSKLYPLERVH